MLAVFVGLLIVGVGLLLLQSLGGHDADADGIDLDGDGVPDMNGDHDLAHGPWLPLANLRFWAFACAGAGGIGTLGLWLTDIPVWIVALVAIVSGLGIGWSLTYLLHRLHRDGSTSMASVDTGRGRLGRVVLPIDAGSRGKVRIEIKGQWVDLVARAEGPLEIGAEVVITEIEGSEALVERAPRELSE